MLEHAKRFADVFCNPSVQSFRKEASTGVQILVLACVPWSCSSGIQYDRIITVNTIVVVVVVISITITTFCYICFLAFSLEIHKSIHPFFPLFWLKKTNIDLGKSRNACSSATACLKEFTYFTLYLIFVIWKRNNNKFSLLLSRLFILGVILSLKISPEIGNSGFLDLIKSFTLTVI